MAYKPDEREADLFISHAWEDKEEVAQPLAEALRQRGLRIWYDEYVLQLGDSLREKIDQGLSTSRFGLVILSPGFFAKEWPKRELAGLFARETSEGNKVILPVWHRLTYQEVTRHSPMLADKLAVSTERGIPYVAEQVVRALGGVDRDPVERQKATLALREWDDIFKGLPPLEVWLRELDGLSTIESFRSFIGLRHGDTRETVERLFGRPDAVEEKPDRLDFRYGEDVLGDLEVELESRGAQRVRIITLREAGVERLRALGLADEKILIGKDKRQIEALYGPAESYRSGFLNFETPALKISFLCHGKNQRCDEIMLYWWYR